jgi:hypothetical protein
MKAIFVGPTVKILLYFFLLSINQIDECHISQDQTQKNKFSERSSPGRQVYSFI